MASNELHAHCDRYANTQTSNAVGKLRGRTLRVLNSTLVEIRLYLDRPTPNIEGALLMVSRLEKFKQELEAESEA